MSDLWGRESAVAWRGVARRPHVMPRVRPGPAPVVAVIMAVTGNWRASQLQRQRQQ